ncbi:hypothetical protein FisN_30Lh065 [Fistulifera solaris]|uniref:Uncharacterized protein n=1 Tax=Fistulifera solaris TaxID=1519565 RepID=A0A1Z5JIE2_FISSO|nr:hypothetical protein FisN_30Lh065 [Fistulifera solaris]|eukprot:GAX13774.1 hypothetical protein FisN_30Lh065 [Fistulifera solaris]
MNVCNIHKGLLGLTVAACYVATGKAFVPRRTNLLQPMAVARGSSLSLKEERNNLEETFGGYTAKQRLREEVESPFRTVRLFFFGSSTLSALVAFYFSLLTGVKAYAGYSDAPPMEEAVQSIAINVIAVAACAAITYRDWRAGESNLARIKQGGALAKLVVQRASDESDIATLSDYRRSSRVLIAAGGKEYIAELCRSLNADQLVDKNTLPEAIQAADILLVPVLLQEARADLVRVGDTSSCWKETTPQGERDRNFDVNRANEVVGFPRGPMAWAEVLEPEIRTAIGQGFDVCEKGITLIIKKNGKILRRATGQPQWSGLLGTMEVLDGSKFGMPGDDEKYGTGSR